MEGVVLNRVRVSDPKQHSYTQTLGSSAPRPSSRDYRKQHHILQRPSLELEPYDHLITSPISSSLRHHPPYRNEETDDVSCFPGACF